MKKLVLALALCLLGTSAMAQDKTVDLKISIWLPPAHPSDDIAGTPHPSPGASGDFSQLFAAGAEKAQKGGSGASAKAFDAEEAKTAVAAVLKLVAACKEPGGPTGQSAAAVTFDASGHVSSVTIGAPFLSR